MFIHLDEAFRQAGEYGAIAALALHQHPLQVLGFRDVAKLYHQQSVGVGVNWYFRLIRLTIIMVPAGLDDREAERAPQPLPTPVDQTDITLHETIEAG